MPTKHVYKANNQTKNIFNNLPRKQEQPYITWKYKPESGYMKNKFNNNYQGTNNKTYNLGVATNSFYDNNKNSSRGGFVASRHPSANRRSCPGNENDYHNGNFIKFKPNPIKHWRKQLEPNKIINSRRVSIRQAIDVPGGITRLDAHKELNNYPEDYCNQNVNHIPNYVKNNDMSIDKITSQNGCSIYNPQRIQRSASTIVKKTYHQTNSAYLKSRLKLYNQNQTLSQKKNNNYYQDNEAVVLKVLPPTNNKTEGSQLFNSTYNIDSSCNKHNVIYKPNNVNFSNEGAVSSNLRTFNLQRLSINKSAHSLKEKFGRYTVNNSQYKGLGYAPITSKTFYQIIPGEDTSIGCVQIKNTQNSRRQLTGGSGRHVVSEYNKTGMHNSDIIPSLNGNIILKSKNFSNLKMSGKGPLFDQKFSCQTIKNANVMDRIVTMFFKPVFIF